jgi:ketosteroid isomerase-like protein
MKLKYRILALIALASVTNVSTARVDETASAERYIKESESQWAQAGVTGDTALIQRIVADDFIGVEPDGSFYKKPEAVAEAREGKEIYISNKLTTVNVRFYGDTAVAQGSETWERRTGKPKRGSYVWTDTWVKRNNKWQIVAAEDVTVPASN